jgi:hypothetical protein
MIHAGSLQILVAKTHTAELPKLLILNGLLSKLLEFLAGFLFWLGGILSGLFHTSP